MTASRRPSANSTNFGSAFELGRPADRIVKTSLVAAPPPLDLALEWCIAPECSSLDEPDYRVFDPRATPISGGKCAASIPRERRFS